MMKKLYIYLLAAAAAVVSCAKENFVEPSENNFRIAVAETDATKSYLDDHYKIVWERGVDKISLFLTTDNNCLTATSTGTTTYLEKAGELEGLTSKWAYALYPYDAEATNTTGTITTTLPAAQKAIPNQYSNIIAVGSSDCSNPDAPTPIIFQTCVTLVEIDLQTDGVTSISLRGNSGETLAGTLRTSAPTKPKDPEKPTPAPDPAIINGEKEVSISDGGKVLAKGKYYLAIAPQTFRKGLAITLKGDGFETEKITSNTVTATRGKRLIAGELNLTPVTPDSGFYLTYDDGEQSGTLYPGAHQTFVYSYSGINDFHYKVNTDASELEVQYILDGGAAQATSGGRLAKDITADGSLLNLLPTPCTGGTNTFNDMLKNEGERGSKAEPIDLSYDNTTLLHNPYMSNTGRNTANCYVVRAPGWYSFPLVYGNAIKEGASNPNAFIPSVTTTTSLSPFIDACGQAITQPFINNGSKQVAKARLEWTDVAGLISDEVSVVGSGTDASIVFEVPKAYIREGNALISALAADGSVLWSWHIWVSGQPSGNWYPVEVTNINNTNFDFMQVNIGWVEPYTSPLVYPSRETRIRLKQTSSNKVIEFTLVQTGASLPENQLGNCPYYQWGRKEPFVATDGKLYPGGEDGPVVVGKKKTWYNASRRDTIGTRAAQLGESLAAFISNPVTYNIDSKGDNKYANAWNANHDRFSTPASRSDNAQYTEKTVYDPCPVGACVPPIGAWSAFNKENVAGSYNYGYYFYAKPHMSGDITFYPAMGSLSTSNATSTKIYANVQNFGVSISYWSSCPNNASSAFYLSCYNGGAVNISYGSYRQYVYPIRPNYEH